MFWKTRARGRFGGGGHGGGGSSFVDFADEGGGRGRRRGGGDVVDVWGEFVVVVEVDDEALTGESHGAVYLGGCEREEDK